MSEASEKGKSYEQHVAGVIRKKLKVAAVRDNKSGALWTRKSDIHVNIPIHFEVKDHKTVKVKEWYEQASNAASPLHAPVVAFAHGSKDLCIISLQDLLNFIQEIKDLTDIITDLRQTPEVGIDIGDPAGDKGITTVIESSGATKYCREGHIADDYGYCMQLRCKYSRGYKPSKVKK